MLDTCIFIVPNPAMVINETEGSARLLKQENNSRATFGMKPLKKGDKLIQVWITSPEIDNWANSRVTFENKQGQVRATSSKDETGNFFPSYLTLEEIGDVKEGELIALPLFDGKLNLILEAAQLNYGYRRIGSSFEDVRDSLIDYAEKNGYDYAL